MDALDLVCTLMLGTPLVPCRPLHRQHGRLVMPIYCSTSGTSLSLFDQHKLDGDHTPGGHRSPSGGGP